MPREPHLLDYLIVLRKHQWLIFFSCCRRFDRDDRHFPHAAHVRSHGERRDRSRDTPMRFRFNESEQGDDYEDLEDYIVTQSKILQSETLAMQTVRSMGLDTCLNLAASPGKPVKPVAPGSDASSAAAGRPGRISWRLERQARAEHAVCWT